MQCDDKQVVSDIGAILSQCCQTGAVFQQCSCVENMDAVNDII